MDSVAQRLSTVGAGAALELRGVTRLFGALAALTDVTLTVRPGERRAVLGSNGAGKTTLFNCITGDFPPTSGTIRFFGEDVTHFPPYERIRRGLAAHLSDFRAVSGAHRSRQRLSGLLRRFARTLFAIPAARQRRADAFGRRSGPGGASDARSRNGASPNSPMASSASSRSRSRSPARRASSCSTNRPPACRRPSARELVEILTALPAHIGYIIIEHDMDVALRVVESVTMMHNGRIFKEGPPQEIESDPEVQELYLGGGHG